MIGTTDGSTAAIAKLVPRVRGLSFVLAATGEQAGFYTKSLEQIRNASEETLDREFKLQIETNAESVTREITKLKNFLSADLGESLLATADKVLKLAGGADTITAAIEHSLPVLELAATGATLVAGRYIATTLATTRLATATTALGTSFRFAFGWAGVALAGYEAAAFAADLYEKAGEKRLKAASDAEEKLLDATRKAAQDRVRVQEEESRQIAEIAGQRTAAITQAYNLELAAAKAVDDQLVTEAKGVFAKLIAAREGYVNELRDHSTSKNDLSKLPKSGSTRRTVAKKTTNLNWGLRGASPHEEIQKRTRRAEDAARTVEAIRSDPNATPADQKQADRLAAQAESDLQKSKSLLKGEDSAVGRDALAANKLDARADTATKALTTRQAKFRIREEEKGQIQVRRQALAAQRRHSFLPASDFAGEARQRIEGIEENAGQARRNVARISSGTARAGARRPEGCRPR